MSENLGRFGRLRQTLLEDGEKIISPINKTKDAPSEPSEPIAQIELIHEWLRICITDGHIEPSQPVCGQYLGWPTRPFFQNSLFVDLELWCRKQGIPKNNHPSQKAFYNIADQIFDKSGDKYCFPTVNVCRERFKQYLEVWHARKTP